MLARNLKAAASVDSITVTRSEVGSFTLANGAWVGNTLFRLQAGDGGSRIEWGERDYLIPASAYDFGDGPVEPAEHDTIAETVNGTACIFRVLPPQSGEPAWRWSDPERTILRVHVKQVA